LAAAPSGSGFQLSLWGLAGILLAADEGLEINLLGLSLGLAAVRPALKLPAIGRLGFARSQHSPPGSSGRPLLEFGAMVRSLSRDIFMQSKRWS
jgi:hypothetical protein